MFFVELKSLIQTGKSISFFSKDTLSYDCLLKKEKSRVSLSKNTTPYSNHGTAFSNSNSPVIRHAH